MGKWTICKEFHFSAGHWLDYLPDDHPCRRMHGHNYKVELFLSSGELDQVGFVKDFGELKSFKAFIDAHFDHQMLNDRMTLNPTAENIAKVLFDVARSHYGSIVQKVRVYETPSCWAEYSED